MVKWVRAVVDAEVEQSGLSPPNIFLGGFSQGAALALHSALFGFPEEPARLGGVMVVSGWLALKHRFMKTKDVLPKSVPIWIGHGVKDRHVPLTFGLTIAEVLKRRGYKKITAENFYTEHQLEGRELRAARAWLEELIPDQVQAGQGLEDAAEVNRAT